MPSSQSDWDAKHRLAAEAPPSEPASIVSELLPILPAGPALDIARGTGRHALFLAGRGKHDTAVDFPSVAGDRLETGARSPPARVRGSDNIQRAGRHLPGALELIQMNLKDPQPPERLFDLI